MLTVRRARAHDCVLMAETLRPADKAEVYAAAGIQPFDALFQGLQNSDLPVVGADENDIPVAMGGVCSTEEPLAGLVWMLATTDIEKHKISFLRQSRDLVMGWHDRYPVLFNAVDERNELHIKWLRWLGFTFIRRIPEHGFEKRPFLEFVRLNNV